HEPAYRFLKKIGIRESMVAEALGDVSRQADVGRGEAVLVMDVAIVDAADRHDIASIVAAMVADELGHGPGFMGGLVLPQPGKMTYQLADKLGLDFPETGEQTSF